MSGKIIFKEVRETKTIELPSFPGSQVEIFTSLSWGDTSKMYELGRTDAMMEYILKSIKQWNFEEEEGKELEVSIENLKKFPDTDVLHIFAQAQGTTVEELEEKGRGALEKKAQKEA
jgi:hypothetical protein